MNSRKTPKTHLVPVIKGVSDPAKGLIFRTYHVRPEQLAASLKNATNKVDKTQVPHITNYDKLAKAVKSNDVTHLRNMFSKDSTVWSSIVKRSNSVPSNVAAKQKLMQSVYAFTLSQDNIFTDVMKANARASSIVEKTTVKHVEKAASKSMSISSKVSEQVYFTPKTNEAQEILMPVTLPPSKSNSNLVVDKKNVNPIDYGKVLTKNKNTEVVDVGSEVSLELSPYINFINPSSNKATNIHSVLNGKTTDGNSVAKNLILRPSVYKENSQYWSEVLASDIVQHNTTDVKMNSYSEIYSYLMLREIDPKRFHQVFESYPNKKIAHIFYKKEDINALLDSDEIDDVDKSLYVAAIDDDKTTKGKFSILSRVKDLFISNDINGALSLFASYSNHLDSKTTFKLLNSTLPDVLSIEYIIKDVFNNYKKSPFSYLLLQVLCARIKKLHYVPYNDIHLFNGTPFTPVLIVKIFNDFINNKKEELVSFIRKNKPSQNEFLVGINAPNTTTPDKQLFIRMNPATLFDIAVDGNDSNYAAVGRINAKNTLFYNESNILYCDPLHNIIFD